MGRFAALRARLPPDLQSIRNWPKPRSQQSNRNAGHNTYLWQDAEWTRAEALAPKRCPAIQGGGPFGDGRSALWGLPISVKDCFDLAGSPTSCGVHFYRDLNGNAARDSWLVEQLRAAGAVIVGKTHLHPLAYGITGENPEYGDCMQPRDPGALTGGSSSGAAASVQEGSAVAAIGTDTGGSVRVPAALCGLAGYRASLGRGNWRGGAHLAESFDTMGWLFRDLEDAPLLAAPFAPAQIVRRCVPLHAASPIVADSFLHDCEPEVVASFRDVDSRSSETLGLEGSNHRSGLVGGCSRNLRADPGVGGRATARGQLRSISSLPFAIGSSGARSLTASEISALRQRHAAFRARMDELFAAHQLILLPCVPVARLAAGADHSQTRAALLRYTAPFSLAGVPTIAIPCAQGGMQLAAARDNDESLLALAAQIGAHRKTSSSD